MKYLIPVSFFISNLISLYANALEVADFEGDYLYRHSIYMTPEQNTIHGIEDIVKIQKVDDKKANVLIETYTHNYHSCQLIGQAQLEGEQLIFKATVDKNLNRGKTAKCFLKISRVENAKGEKAVKVEDSNSNCKLKFCGMQAELSGQFTLRAPQEVQIQDKF